MTCWPEDAAPLITWGLTVTRGPHKERQNLGIYRQQLIGKNKLIMRWLSHRGGALDFQEWCAAHPGERFPVSVALGADPATILGAVTPVPDTLSEYAFAGLLRGTKTEVVKCVSNDLEVPASAEIVLEGYIEAGEMAPEGPYGDHTGYYNEVDSFPVFTVTHITQREDAIYHSTYTGRPPDEPRGAGRGAERSLCADSAKAVPGNRRFLSAAGRVFLSPGGGDHEKTVRRPCQARDDGRLVVPAPVHVYQVRDCLRR